MIRFFSELLHPERKCARVGHDMQRRRQALYLYPPKDWHHVADRAVEKVNVCTRCGLRGSPIIEHREGLSSLTMPTPWWDELREKGRIER